MLANEIPQCFTADTTAVNANVRRKIPREEAINQIALIIKEKREEIRSNKPVNDVKRYETFINTIGEIITATAANEEDLAVLGSLRKKHAPCLKYYPEADATKNIIAEYAIKIKDRRKSRYSQHGSSKYVYRLHTADSVMHKLNATLKNNGLDSFETAQTSKTIMSAAEEFLSVTQTAEVYKNNIPPFLKLMRIEIEIRNLKSHTNNICHPYSEDRLIQIIKDSKKIKDSISHSLEQIKTIYEYQLLDHSRLLTSDRFLKSKNEEEMLDELTGFHKNSYVYAGKIQRKIDGTWRTLTQHFCVIPYDDQGEITKQNIQEMKKLSSVNILYPNTNNYEKYTKFMSQLFHAILDPKTEQNLPKTIRKFEYQLYHLSPFEKGNECLELLFEAIRNTICPEYKPKKYFEALAIPHFSTYNTVFSNPKNREFSPL
jgi:hypothetical protein